MLKKTRGRPSKTSDDRRTNVLRIRLTQDERDVLEGAAQAKALDVSAWARMMLLDSARASK